MKDMLLQKRDSSVNLKKKEVSFTTSSEESEFESDTSSEQKLTNKILNSMSKTKFMDILSKRDLTLLTQVKFYYLT